MSQRHTFALLCLLALVLAGASAAQADYRSYKVELSTVTDVQPGQTVIVEVFIEPEGDPGSGDLFPMENMDLTISYDPTMLTYNGWQPGDFLTNCVWEYQTSTHDQSGHTSCDGAGTVNLINFVHWGELGAAPPHPLCKTVSSRTQVLELSFTATSSGEAVGAFTPVSWYWTPASYPAECLRNSFYHPNLTDTYVAAGVFNNGGGDCAGPSTQCQSWGIPLHNFYGGGVQFAGRTDYDVVINDVVGGHYGHVFGVDVTLAPSDEPGDVFQFENFDLTLSYDPSVVSYVGVDPGDFVNDCAWEYFTYSHDPGPYPSCEGGGTVSLVNIVAWAELSSTPPYPLCNSVTEETQLVRVNFQANTNPATTETVTPIRWYWTPSSIPAQCVRNSFYHPNLYDTYVADEVFDNGTGYCTGPDPACQTWGIPAFDFFGGEVHLNPSNRGDVNCNGVQFDIGDVIVFANYFTYGLSAFSCDLNYAIPATDVNCDGITLSVADLVYMIRIIIGDAPQDPCPDFSPPLAKVVSDTDTLLFRGQSGYAGQTNRPFYFHIANPQSIAGWEARVEYNASILTPSFDAAIGDGESVKYYLYDRAGAYEDVGSVEVKSREAGVLLIRFIPPMDDVPEIVAGSSTLLSVYFNVKPYVPLGSYPVTFATTAYDHNLFSDMDGQAIEPVTVDSVFKVIRKPPPPPSCPVLFAWDGAEFIQENPLLTACEKSNYSEPVTDFYHVQAPVGDDNGRVTFQLRELEQEITHLETFKLITVDHSANTKVTCAVDGSISTYTELGELVSAVDQDGVDRTEEVRAIDGNLFSSSESGHLVLTFAGVDGGRTSLGISAMQKLPCTPADQPDDLPDLPDHSIVIGPDDITIEVLDQSGVWVARTDVPTRQNVREEVVGLDAIETGSGALTVRLSWTGSYATDAVMQYIDAGEQPTISNWTPDRTLVTTAQEAGKAWSESDGTLILQKDDMAEFSFSPDRLPGPGMVRDYIIVAQGLYHPDYGVYSDLVPSGYHLYSNYPNPFNPSTIVSFDLPTASDVKLQIFNINGRLVRTLVDRHYAAGHAEVEWNGRNDAGEQVSSGVYMYRLQTGQFTQTKKMVLVK